MRQQLITNSKPGMDIGTTFGRLLRDSDVVRIAVAFAMETGARELIRMSKNISSEAISIIVGTDFGITEPGALRSLMRHTPNVLLYKGTGMFHPKMYFFRKGSRCDILIGSANLSGSAFYQNVEAMFHWRCSTKSSIARQCLQLFRELKRYSQRVTEKTLELYGKGWTPKPINIDERKILSKKRKPSGPDVQVRNRRLRKFLTRKGIRHNSPRAFDAGGKEFVFTGSFDYGTHKECSTATRKIGGKAWHDVTHRTDVLVIGAKGSPTYLWKEYGTKIERANRYKAATGKPQILIEENWRRALDL